MFKSKVQITPFHCEFSGTALILNVLYHPKLLKHLRISCIFGIRVIYSRLSLSLEEV